MVKTFATHLCELNPPHSSRRIRHPAGVWGERWRSHADEWVGASSTPDRYLDFLQLRGTLMAILRGRRGGRSDSARLARDRGSTGRRPMTALTGRGPPADDTVGPIWALSHRSDRTRMMRLAQSSPHHFRRRGGRSAIRRQMAGAAAMNCVSVMPAASIRLASCAQTNGSDSARWFRCARSSRVAKGRSR
jgi:hypothetical protein